MLDRNNAETKARPSLLHTLWRRRELLSPPTPLTVRSIALMVVCLLVTLASYAVAALFVS